MPLLNAVAATPPSHLPIIAIACQLATHAGHFPAALSSTQHVFLDRAITVTIAIAVAASPTFHGRISAYLKVSTMTLNTSSFS